jgi:hypothetical protein
LPHREKKGQVRGKEGTIIALLADSHDCCTETEKRVVFFDLIWLGSYDDQINVCFFSFMYVCSLDNILTFIFDGFSVENWGKRTIGKPLNFFLNEKIADYFLTMACFFRFHLSSKENLFLDIQFILRCEKDGREKIIYVNSPLNLKNICSCVVAWTVFSLNVYRSAGCWLTSSCHSLK